MSIENWEWIHHEFSVRRRALVLFTAARPGFNIFTILLPYCRCLRLVEMKLNIEYLAHGRHRRRQPGIISSLEIYLNE